MGQNFVNANETYPFLSVGVGEIVDCLRVPLLSNTEERQRQEPVLSHDHEVHEETSRGLDHTDLAVRHRYQPGGLGMC